MLGYAAKYASALLRALPRRGRVRAAGRPAHVPARPGQPARGPPRGGARHRAGRRRRDGEARVVLPRRARRRRGDEPRARLGVPGVRGVRDGRGRRGERLDRPRPHRARDDHVDPPRRRGRGAHLLGRRGGRMAATGDRPRAHLATPDAKHRRSFDATRCSSERSVIPGGVNSPVRAYGSVGGAPRFVAARPRAVRLDAEDREYVDLVASWGPAMLGHAHPQVVEAVQRAAGRRALLRGARPRARWSSPSSCATASRRDGRAPIERLRLVSTGTEATMTAIRLARGVDRARPLIVKFAGHYHGHSDGLLAEAGSGRRDARAARLRRACPRRSPRRRSCCRTTTRPRCGSRSSGTPAASPPSSPRRPRRTWASSRRSPGFNRAIARSRTRTARS